MADSKEDISFHRAMGHLNKSGLHRALGIPEGEKIPAEKVSAAMNSSNKHVAAMARLAHSMAGWKH